MSKKHRLSNNLIPISNRPPDEFQLIKSEVDTFVQNFNEISDLKVESADTFKVLPNIKRQVFDFDKSVPKLKKNEIAKEVKHKKQNTVDTFEDVDTFVDDFSFSNNNDLQSLLVMMTLSSNYNDDVSVEEDGDKERTENDLYPQIDNQLEEYDTERNAEITDILKISSFKKENTDHKHNIARKYVDKWKMYKCVKIKTENKLKHTRKEAVDKFLDKLKQAKNSTEPEDRSKMLVRDYNSYHHRYKMQKHIIALQKAKLEQQNKVIEELKYNKIIDASKQSLSCMKDEVRKTYYDIDKHLKPKIKCLTNELNITEIEEPSLVLQCLKVPKFLQRMEARARERDEKHAVIRERRKQIEEEKLRLKQQAELAKAEMDKEEKTKRIKDLKQKRRKEKIENIRKKQHAERMRALMVMADLHYEKSLMIRYGVRPFQILIQIKRDNLDRAKAHYKFQLIKNIFLHWMFYTEDMWFERNFRAEEHYRKKVLRRAFDSLKKNHYNYIVKKQVAEDYYDFYVTQLVFRKFCEGINVVKQEIELKWAAAVKYHNCNVIFKTFTCWRALPALNALKRDQEARKRKWRQKVMLVLPDYSPPED
ncbi:coiled-coil domain-containing protein 191 [Pieris napi]|uniref:coiled-coil domain-containing protein 191 n=1 Tax=Pieris napi TaxID=78633 RepID=UPI001FB9C205|nr:coiled-coil domain-containing protein 191 [Pieris napi]